MVFVLPVLWGMRPHTYGPSWGFLPAVSCGDSLQASVVDAHKKPLMPCTEKRTRHLLERCRAVVHTVVPFTIRMKDRTAEEFGFPAIAAEAKKPLKDAAMMNATRWRLYEQFKAAGLPVEGGSGERTQQQRPTDGRSDIQNDPRAWIGNPQAFPYNRGSPASFPKSTTTTRCASAKARLNTSGPSPPMCRSGPRKVSAIDNAVAPMRTAFRSDTCRDKRATSAFRRAIWSQPTNPAARTPEPGPDASPHVLRDGLS